MAEKHKNKPLFKPKTAQGSVGLNSGIPISTRISEIADAVGGNSDLAKICGVSEGTIRNWRNGASEPTASNLIDIARAGGVTVERLVTGTPPAGQDDAEFILVPRYNVDASAGAGSVVERESEIGRLAFRRDWLAQKGLTTANLAIIRVKGDSMSPTVRDGSLVLVDTRQERVAEDGIYIIMKDGHLVAKRLQVDFAASGVYIRSDNPKYDPQHLDKDAAADLYVIGRVIWAGGEV